MNGPITNCNVRPRLPVERGYLYQPTTTWTYAHHQSITFFQGRYYAIWSNGRVNEDDPGQRVLISSSPDGMAWIEPQPLLGPLQGDHSEIVLTAAGFHQYRGTLVAYAGAYEYTAEAMRNGIEGGQGHQDTRLYAMTTTNGRDWSAASDMGIAIVPNHGPQATASGRLIISGNISFPYTDDPTGLAGWTMTGVYPPDMASTIFDDSESFWIVQKRMGWPAGLCEGSFYQTDDRVLHMLLRTTGRGYAGKLWLTESSDDGASWSAPQEIEFSDNNTKFHFGRLPDGRFYYVGSPDAAPKGARNPLVLSISEDGARFCKHYILADEDYVQKAAGRYKGGLYGYPHTMVHDGYLYVIASLRKEAVAVLRTPLAAL
jgi:hypothetical protein